ncbi:MAG: hypothetical protein Q7T82_01235 [Armatimonadota bacterium]|nr:hypothetical protein [Armatimonadota bacterium]
MLGTLAAMWVFVEMLNVSERNIRRMIRMSIVTTTFIWLSFLFGGYCYVFLYPADKAVILAGPQPWAHSVCMEVKEHLFFVLLLLSTYLPVIARDGNMIRGRDIRRIGLAVAGSIVFLGLAMGRSGSIVSLGVRAGLGG